MPHKTFVDGQVLLASDVNEYLMRQAVVRCTSVAERDAIPGPEPGMLAAVGSDIYAYTTAGWRLMHSDSQWLEVPYAKPGGSQNFSGYGGTGTAPVWGRRIGNMIELRALIKPNTAAAVTALNGTELVDAALIATLPEQLRMKGAPEVVSVQQGSGTNRWALSVHQDGTMYAIRYGPAAATTSAWMPLSVVYMAG